MTEDPVAQLLGYIGSRRPPHAPLAINIKQLCFANYYWSMGGEDAALRHIFKQKINRKELGTYVDIGCNVPAFISNSYMFYCMGWNGLCVDADENYRRDWAKVRPRDTFESVAISEAPGDAFFFLHTSNLGMSYVDTVMEARGIDYEAPRPVRMRRLDDVFAQHLKGQKIDFMSIDIEGGELSALKSNDWNQWRPHAILMECVTFSFDAPYDTPAMAYLHALGYRLTSKIGANVILLDQT